MLQQNFIGKYEIGFPKMDPVQKFKFVVCSKKNYNDDSLNEPDYTFEHFCL